MAQWQGLTDAVADVSAQSDVLRRAETALVEQYNRELTTFIFDVRARLHAAERLDDAELEALVLQIPMYNYFVAQGLEALGLDGEVASARRKEAHHAVFVTLQGGVEARNRQADAETREAQLVEAIFDHAYKQLKLQLDIAQTLGTAAKKILSKRMLETQQQLWERGVRSNVHDD